MRFGATKPDIAISSKILTPRCSQTAPAARRGERRMFPDKFTFKKIALHFSFLRFLC